MRYSDVKRVKKTDNTERTRCGSRGCRLNESQVDGDIRDFIVHYYEFESNEYLYWKNDSEWKELIAKKVRFFLPVVTMKDGIYHLSIQTDSDENHENVEPLPVVITVSNSVRIVSIENMAKTCKEDTMKETENILNDLNGNNWGTVTSKMVALKIESKQQLQEVAEVIHQRAVNNSNLTEAYAALCEVVNTNKSFNTSLKNLDVTLMQVLLPKCYDLFYSYKRNRTEMLSSEVEQTATSTAEQNIRLLANSTFISELYNRRVLPEPIVWNYIIDLVKENGNTQIHCLANILKLAGTKLSETYSLSRIVGQLLILENEANRDETMSPELRCLINQVKVWHAKFWIHRVPDKKLKENLRSVHENLIRPNKTDREKRQYERSLMVECIVKDCRDLFTDFVNRKGSHYVKSLLSPALRALLNTDQLEFAVHMIVTAVKEKSPRTKTAAGKLLADLVKERSLSRLIVYMGFDKVRNDEEKLRNLTSNLETIQQTFKEQI